MSKKNPRTAQDMLKSSKFSKALVKNEWHFQIFTHAFRGPLVGHKYPDTGIGDNDFTPEEIGRSLQRMVQCVRILEDTADEDLQVLYEQKFGKGDGL